MLGAGCKTCATCKKPQNRKQNNRKLGKFHFAQLHCIEIVFPHLDCVKIGIRNDYLRKSEAVSCSKVFQTN